LYIQGVNGVLQGRGNILRMDMIRAKEAFDDCESDFECPTLNQRNLDYQKQTVRTKRKRKFTFE
jgi:hypothetical protein